MRVKLSDMLDCVIGGAAAELITQMISKYPDIIRRYLKIYDPYAWGKFYILRDWQGWDGRFSRNYICDSKEHIFNPNQFIKTKWDDFQERYYKYTR